MATRNRASKTSRRAGVDTDFIPYANSKKNQKKTEKAIKNAGAKSLLIALVVLFVGAAIGCGVCYILSRNDKFEIIGGDELTLSIGENYIDEGVLVSAFGKDCSDKVEIETNLTKNADGSFTASEEGTYYIIYRVNNLKYGSIFKVQKIRLVTFVEASEGGE